MLAVKHILFPFDFSDRCYGAVPFVEAMARRFDAKVTLISVAQPFVYAGIGDPGAGATNADEIIGELEERLAGELVHELALRVERVAEFGDPAALITDFAHANGVDLIMMPTHGYGPFRSLLLGSVTAKVLHDAECPVWTSAHVEGPHAREHMQYRNILCAVDGTPKTVLAMQWAARLSKDTDATLRLIHAIPETEGWPASPIDRQFEVRKAIKHMQKSAGVEAALCVIPGNVAEVVREEARRHEADLVVIGRGTVHEAFGRLRTHAYGIIRRSPCPVLSV